MYNLEKYYLYIKQKKTENEIKIGIKLILQIQGKH